MVWVALVPEGSGGRRMVLCSWLRRLIFMPQNFPCQSFESGGSAGCSTLEAPWRNTILHGLEEKVAQVPAMYALALAQTVSATSRPSLRPAVLSDAM